MRANELLLWLSARCEGSWGQFRAAVDELHASDEDGADASIDGEFSLHHRLRQSLDCLGHAEFFAQECEQGWRVAPPTLAARQINSNFVGLLCGARTTELLDRINGFTDGCQVERRKLLAAPDRVRVLADSSELLERLAEVVGVHVQRDAPFAILMHIPRINSQWRESADEFPVGADWTIHEFDARKLRWSEVRRAEAQSARRGLFRFRDRFQTRVYFARRNSVTHKVGRGVGIYQALRAIRRRVIMYSGERAELRLPAICRPPRLLERALALCSGIPPIYDAPSAQLIYQDVPANIAALAAELLLQPLR
jgi:hypothetical protein